MHCPICPSADNILEIQYSVLGIFY
jgi:hypothetical protein